MCSLPAHFLQISFRFDIIVAYIAIARFVIARTLLCISLLQQLTHNQTVPIWALVVVSEVLINTSLSAHFKQYFPGSVYNYFHTIRTKKKWTGDFLRSSFSTTFKLRMLLLVLALNISVALSVLNVVDGEQNQRKRKFIRLIAQITLIVSMVMELWTLLLNSIFVQTMIVEFIWRVLRYKVLLILLVIDRCFGSPSWSRELLDDTQFDPLHLHLSTPRPRATSESSQMMLQNGYSDSSSPRSPQQDGEQDLTLEQIEAESNEDDARVSCLACTAPNFDWRSLSPSSNSRMHRAMIFALSLHGLGAAVMFPIYAFVFKWTG